MANDFEPQSKSLVDWLSERTNRDGERVRRLEIAKLGKVWVEVGLLTGIYGWQNGFDDVGGSHYPFQYRLFDKDQLQVRGTIDNTGPSGAIGFTFLRPFWPTKDIAIWGNIDVSGAIQLAVIRVNSANGQATINY